MHLLSSEKISYLMAICHKCLEHSVVFLAEVFWSNLHLRFPPIPFSWSSRLWSFFSSLWELKRFLESFKVCYVVLMKYKSLHIKNRKVWLWKCVSLMYCFNFFSNQLWWHLISNSSFRNVNMCLLGVAMCEKCRSSPFQLERVVKSLRTGGWGVIKKF